MTTIESWIRRGRLHPIFHEVYAVGHPSLTREERWLAAVMACGPGACLSHLSAALLWRIVPAFTIHRGIPVTTIPQTLLDLAATFDPKPLERALGEAQLSPHFAAHELDTAIEASTQPGKRRLQQAWNVEHKHGIPRNLMERKFLKLIRATDLPAPQANQRWNHWEIDALWLPPGVAVELDGRDPHTRAEQFQRDRDKDADLQLAGLIALCYTWADLTRRPAKVIEGCTRAYARAQARA